LIVVGATEADVAALGDERLHVTTLGLEAVGRVPLRLVSSIMMAEVARQVGARKRLPFRPTARPPTYQRGLPVLSTDVVFVISGSDLLAF